MSELVLTIPSHIKVDKPEIKIHSSYVPLERKSKHLYDWLDRINKKLAKSRLG